MIARKTEHNSPTRSSSVAGGTKRSLRAWPRFGLDRIQDNLHPLIEQRVRRQFLLRGYEQAIFAAMKAVEVRVRKLGDYSNDVIGVDLMTRAAARMDRATSTDGVAG
jgi:hypothetical protein